MSFDYLTLEGGQISGEGGDEVRDNLTFILFFSRFIFF